ncbi:RNA-binding protein 41 [Lingula anatina]|uniref:RNA-binding protein 41 n=1 Tax=Lingula anatina TaxID=7574 RepID=A0A1S3HMH8_LINAN|nr:RNA-binding protein 41 [Lingula anatina]|eukprot:XP_013386249.1 RNA-binding protein 41 [Lingula anatina]
MPGGSVNGRPLREDPNSYSRTGIPCGNPRRYQSGAVVKMGPDASRPPLSKYARLDMPAEDIETEGERQLKRLLEKQLKTDVTLADQMRQKKVFSEATVFRPESGVTSGQLSLDQYRVVTERETRAQTLRQYGLSEEEVLLKIQADTGALQTGSSKLRMASEVREKKLQEIEKKIAQKEVELSKPDTFGGTAQLSRQAMDLEKAISQDSNKAKLTQVLVTTKNWTKTDYPADHPMNNLHSLIKEVSQVKPRMEGGYSRVDEGLLGQGSDVNTKEAETDFEFCGPLTKEEMKKQELHSSKLDRGVSDNIVITCDAAEESCDNNKVKGQGQKVTDQGQGSSDVKDEGQETQQSLTSSRTLDVYVEPLSEEHIKQNCLTLEEIRALPRFNNYEPGEPSQTLYLKNLPPSVEEKDLVALFVRFQNPAGPRIIFRLFKHRKMKGQAFVTFDSAETAGHALSVVNGYNLKGKPVIIQYGKKKDVT